MSEDNHCQETIIVRTHLLHIKRQSLSKDSCCMPEDSLVTRQLLQVGDSHVSRQLLYVGGLQLHVRRQSY